MGVGQKLIQEQHYLHYIYSSSSQQADAGTPCQFQRNASACYMKLLQSHISRSLRSLLILHPPSPFLTRTEMGKKKSYSLVNTCIRFLWLSEKCFSVLKQFHNKSLWWRHYKSRFLISISLHSSA